MLSEEQYNRLKDQIDGQIAGTGNAARPLLLYGGLEWHEMSFNPKDMDFINGMNASARHRSGLLCPAHAARHTGDNTYSN